MCHLATTYPSISPWAGGETRKPSTQVAFGPVRCRNLSTNFRIQVPRSPARTRSGTGTALSDRFSFRRALASQTTQSSFPREPRISICGSALDLSDPPVYRIPLSFSYVGRVDIWARTSVMSSRPSWPRRENCSLCCFSGTCRIYILSPSLPPNHANLDKELATPPLGRPVHAFDAREPPLCHLCTTMRPLHP